METIAALQETPVPTILVVAGLLFVFLALGGTLNVGGIPANRSGIIGSLGVVLFVLGVFLFVIRPHANTAIANSPTTIPIPTVDLDRATSAPTTAERLISTSTLATEKRLASPIEALQSYFGLVNDSDYSRAWLMLTTNYRNHHNSEGFSKFEEYWRTQGRVEITDSPVVLQSSRNDRTVVEVKINFPDQFRQGIYHFLLLQDSNLGWMLDQYCDVDYSPRCIDQGF